MMTPIDNSTGMSCPVKLSEYQEVLDRRIVWVATIDDEGGVTFYVRSKNKLSAYVEILYWVPPVARP